MTGRGICPAAFSECRENSFVACHECVYEGCNGMCNGLFNYLFFFGRNFSTYQSPIISSDSYFAAFADEVKNEVKKQYPAMLIP